MNDFYKNKIINGNWIDIMKDLDDNIDMLLTDPPYNLLEKQGALHLFRQSRRYSIRSFYGFWHYCHCV